MCILLEIKSSHYNEVIMGAIASEITSLTIVYSTVYSEADQRKYQSSASLAFVQGIHRGPVNSPHKWAVTRKMFPFDDVIMLVCNIQNDTDDMIIAAQLFWQCYVNMFILLIGRNDECRQKQIGLRENTWFWKNPDILPSSDNCFVCRAFESSLNRNNIWTFWLWDSFSGCQTS